MVQLLAIGVLAACAASPRESGQVAATPPASLDAVRVNDLERAFWACDYVATTKGIQATPIAACRYATEELKRQKFGGSFARLLEWWRVNKAAEHRRMARLTGQ